ncbi:NADH dehydrogenase [ubiquinone] iron-sulfur protein 6, mitochondrial [Rhinatrema bivittatum]|uniref:NADH dehydrogenase [ubiquinone] iron-sulfur protein 6, mitochondrial n=1 Tax=Rhinatrema bivittatum TaxID=194408 RepID=UPI00112675BD|nr:NADH dehydrogenase [ubiquinone] iron-sulfur protein 6, mitochondrial [Rhinatrema bivittatum]
MRKIMERIKEKVRALVHRGGIAVSTLAAVNFLLLKSVKWQLLRNGGGASTYIALSLSPRTRCQWSCLEAAVRKYSCASATESEERVTHTGQVFAGKDYRKVRFVARQKEVNEQFAINLIAEQPVTEISSRVISCDGGGGALGHPKVYINLDKDSKTGTCGYCGLQFKQKHHH